MKIEAKASQTVQDVSIEPVKQAVHNSVDKNKLEK